MLRPCGGRAASCARASALRCRGSACGAGVDELSGASGRAAVGTEAVRGLSEVAVRGGVVVLRSPRHGWRTKCEMSHCGGRCGYCRRRRSPGLSPERREAPA